MLDEYFSIGINDDGQLTSIPMLMRDYTPNLDKLPLFLMRLGPQVRQSALLTKLATNFASGQVNWKSERQCFQSFLRELALFYNPTSLSRKGFSSQEHLEEEKAERWQLQHVLFPAMRRYFIAPKTLLDQDVVQIANLPDLYRVFERC
jgi:DNA mismatch repair protein MLH1